MDYDKWATADLRRYYTLLAHVLDAEVFRECALSDTEARELERFRLGIRGTHRGPSDATACA